MKKIIAKKKGGFLEISENEEDAELLYCPICGETNRNNLFLEGLLLGWGMGGDEYSFCESCWNSKDLGKKILKLLEIEEGLKYKDEILILKEVE